MKQFSNLFRIFSSETKSLAILASLGWLGITISEFRNISSLKINFRAATVCILVLLTMSTRDPGLFAVIGNALHPGEILPLFLDSLDCSLFERRLFKFPWLSKISEISSSDHFFM